MHNMKTSAAGIAHLHSFEKLVLEAYPDPGSRDGLPWTIGWGTTWGIEEGMVIDEETADRWFAEDLLEFEMGVNELVKVPLTQGQFDALVSFAYNVGLDIDQDTKAEGLGDSTLLRKLNARDYAGAAEEFVKWNKNDGVVMRGLTRRRLAEKAMFLRRVS